MMRICLYVRGHLIRYHGVFVAHQGLRVRPAWRFRNLLRYARSTLEDVYNALDMPPLLRAILAGQSGDYLLPPRDVCRTPIHA